MSMVWYKHYPSDWRANKKLRMVSRAARSFWLDCIGLMYEEGTHRLEVSGRAMTVKEIAAALGDNPRTAKKLLNELIEFDVCGVEDGSYIVSRRVLRDLKKAEKDTSNGRKGGNPSLKTRGKGGEGVNPEVKAQNQKPEPEPEKEDKSSSSKEADFYQEYLDAHPKPFESQASERAFNDLIAGGVDPADIIGSAKAYAVTAAGFSNPRFVQQSDNFLDPERGKWKAHVPKASAVRATDAEILAFYANVVIEKKPSASSTVSGPMAQKLLAASLVTAEQLSQAGVAS